MNIIEENDNYAKSVDNFFGSSIWQNFKLKANKWDNLVYLKYLDTVFPVLIKKIRNYSVGYCVSGPYVYSEKSKDFEKYIKNELFRKYKVNIFIFNSVPNGIESGIDFQYNISPRNYYVLDLKDYSESSINSKYRGRVRNKLGFNFEYTDSPDESCIKTFYSIYSDCATIKGFKNKDYIYISQLIDTLSVEKKVIVAKVKYKGKVIASSINVLGYDSAYYLYSGITKDSSIVRGYPGYYLVYETAVLLKNLGFKSYNLWGGDLNKKDWFGFTEFKLNMGSSIVGEYKQKCIAKSKIDMLLFKLINKYIYTYEF